MKKSKFSEEQIAYALRQAESGTAVAYVCRQLGISDATFYAWKKRFAHLGIRETAISSWEPPRNRIRENSTFDDRYFTGGITRSCEMRASHSHGSFAA